MVMTKQKKLFQEGVYDSLELLKKKISKKRGTLDRHLIKVESELDSMESEKELLEKLQDILPAKQPKIIEPVDEEEK